MCQRHYTFGVAFAVLDAQGSGLQISVVDGQCQQFGATNAGGVECFQDGAVANIAWLGCGRGFDQAPGFCFCHILKREIAGGICAQKTSCIVRPWRKRQVWPAGPQRKRLLKAVLD